ncbi:unnamed protein product, partial [Brassica oleracea]
GRGAVCSFFVSLSLCTTNMASKDPIREQPPPQGIEIKATQDQFFGFYRGIAPGVTGSLATGATYFGVIESTKKWIEESHPNLGGHLVHFIAGAIEADFECQ